MFRRKERKSGESLKSRPLKSAYKEAFFESNFKSDYDSCYNNYLTIIFIKNIDN